MRITTLAENTATKVGMLAEHGLSMFVEVGGLCLMLDTGQTGTAVHNARALGVDLSRVDHIVLSHGHQDHTGGLKEVLGAIGHEVAVHAQEQVFDPRYVVRSGGKPRYSGLPYLRAHLEALGAVFHLSAGPATIAEGIMTTGPVPRNSGFEKIDSDLRVAGDTGLVQDEVPDDQALVVKTPRGLVVLLGCAHRGMVNTLVRAREVANEDRIYAVLGGTHLGFATSEQLDRTISALREMGVERIGVSHCTGLPAAGRLAAEFGDRFFYNNVGSVTEL